MGRPRKTPPEFPSDWHYEAHLEALSRELSGRQNRLAELEALNLPDDDPVMMETKGEIAAVKSEIQRYSGHGGSSKRPKAAKAEKR